LGNIAGSLQRPITACAGHITTGVECGLHCLLYLADSLHESEPASVRALAELQGVPVAYVAKLFTKLQKAGLVVATEGARGGFRLARPARSISVLDVITAIDGEKALFECGDIRGQCAVFDGKRPGLATRGVCSIHAIMLEADARMRKVLASRTLADIAAMVTSKAPAAYMQKLERWFEERSTPR
jgi:Rrf2 family protein